MNCNKNYILCLNSGSSSLKFKVFKEVDLRAKRFELARAIHVSSIGANVKVEVDGKIQSNAFKISDVGSAARQALGLVPSDILNKCKLGVHRIVHGGSQYRSACILNEKVLEDLKELSALSPLHNSPAIDAILEFKKLLVPEVQHVAVFDTSFFQAMPLKAVTYALPKKLSEEHEIRRYGFHGLAHEYMQKACSNNQAQRIITLQLGSGASVAAILDGVPIDTSMGFTPLEGLVMATRSGDLDPAIPNFLARKLDLSANKIVEVLNKESGLLGLSNVSGSVKELLLHRAEGNAEAALALDVYVYRIVKYIGAYVAALGGLDALVFGGGVGESAWEIREEVLAALQCFGVELDSKKNKEMEVKSGDCEMISKSSSKVFCCVVGVDEESLMLEKALEVRLLCKVCN